MRQSNAFAAVDRRRSVDGNFLDVSGRVADKHSHKHVARVVVHILGRADLFHEAFVHDDDSVRRSNLFTHKPTKIADKMRKNALKSLSFKTFGRQ